ncbi:hypothetical protein HWV62_20834 [Athelia sp. TMB]|nr:hypothetical protein HWV62_20834 [Athelia sp. TMB]
MSLPQCNANTFSGTETSRQKLISDGVLGATILVTAGAMWYLLRKIRLVKPDVIYARRKARQVKANSSFSPYAAGGPTEAQNSSVFNPNASDTTVHLNPAGYQQWDANGHAIGYAPDPRLNVYQPEPQRAHPQMLAYREDSGGTGTTYPQGLTDGRSPVRQESSDSGHSGTPPQRRETFDLPRVASPEAGAGDYDHHNPFESDTAYPSAPSFPASGPHPPSYPTTHPHPQPSYGAGANLSQASDRSSVLPNPFDDADEDDHPRHVHQPTDSSYVANDGHSYPEPSLR